MRRMDLALVVAAMMSVGCGTQEQAAPVGPDLVTAPNGQMVGNSNLEPKTIESEPVKTTNDMDTTEPKKSTKKEEKSEDDTDETERKETKDSADTSVQTSTNNNSSVITGAVNLIQTFLQLVSPQYGANGNYNLTWLRQQCQQTESQLNYLYNDQVNRTYDQYTRNLIYQDYQRRVYDIRTRCQIEERRILGYSPY